MGSKIRTNRILESLNGAKDSLKSLTDLWQSHDATWESSPKIYQQAAKAALDLGEGFLAYDIATEGLAHFKSDPLLAQMQALALARTGSPSTIRHNIRSDLPNLLNCLISSFTHWLLAERGEQITTR